MNKVIVITGATAGIGEATALYLKEKDYTIYCLARSIGKHNINYISCDVTCSTSVEAAIQTIIEKEGRIDAVINNAGIGISGAIEYTRNEDIAKIFDVNFLGISNIVKSSIPSLRKSSGKIINIGSVAGELAIPFQSYYSATKASVSIFSECLSMELKPFKIKVTCILPGDTKTAFTANRKKDEVIDDIYNDRIRRSVSKMEKDERNGAKPLKVAKVIYKAIKRKNPPVKITVGFTYKVLLFLKKILPSRIILAVIYRMYGK